MTHSFDIVRDPWIRVKFNTGERKEIGVRELIKEAHNIVEIVEPNSKYSYGILNFLTALIASVYDLSDIEAKAKILFSNNFDMTEFDSYIEKCEKDRPNCFNLFGENPFYQNVYAKYKMEKGKKYNTEDIGKLKLKDTAGIGKIALDIPSGNNTAHFVNDILVGKRIDFKETVKALLSYSLYQAGQDGPNSANGVNGGMNYPEYFSLRGKNLLHVILFNTITERTWHDVLGDSIPYKGNAVWEMEASMIPKEEVSYVSMTEGLTFQNRYVLLGEPDYNNTIGEVYFGPGRVFGDSSVDKKDKTIKSLWRQPNAAYVPIYKKENGKEDRTEINIKPLMMSSAYDLWNDMGDFFSISLTEDNNKLPLTVLEYRTLLAKYRKKMSDLGYSFKLLTYRIYYICVDGGKYPPKAEGVYENYFPTVLMENTEHLKNFNMLIKNASSIGRLLKSEVYKLPESADAMKKAQWYKRIAEQYYNTMSVKYIPELLEDIYNISDSENYGDEICKIFEDFKYKIKKLAIKTYKDYIMSGYSNVFEKTESGIYRGFYGIINSNLSKISRDINERLGIEIKKEGENKDE